MGAEPEQRRQPPAGDAPAEEHDHREQEREHDRSPGRGQQVIRLGAPGREEGAEHQAMFPYRTVDGHDPAEDPHHCAEQRADRAGPCGPADQSADADADREHGEKNAPGSSGVELRRGGPLHPRRE